MNVDLVLFTFEGRQVRTDNPRRRTAALALFIRAFISITQNERAAQLEVDAAPRNYHARTYITSVPRPKIAVHRKTTFSLPQRIWRFVSYAIAPS